MYDDSREATNKWISHFYRYTKWRVLSSSYIADNVGKICTINAIVSILFELVCHILCLLTIKFQSNASYCFARFLTQLPSNGSHWASFGFHIIENNDISVLSPTYTMLNPAV